MTLQCIFPIKVSITIDTVLNFDGDGDVAYKQTFNELIAGFFVLHILQEYDTHSWLVCTS